MKRKFNLGRYGYLKNKSNTNSYNTNSNNSAYNSNSNNSYNSYNSYNSPNNRRTRKVSNRQFGKKRITRKEKRIFRKFMNNSSFNSNDNSMFDSSNNNNTDNRIRRRYKELTTNNSINSHEKRDLDILEKSQLSICLGKPRSECNAPECVFQENKCVPNVLNLEKMCFGKSYSSCRSPCKFYGKSIHDKNACHYKFENIDEIKMEQKLIADEIKALNKFLNMLKTKNKSIVYHLTREIGDINTKLQKLNEKKEKYLKKMAKSFDETGNTTKEFSELNETMFKLKSNKEIYKAILENIRYLNKTQEKA